MYVFIYVNFIVMKEKFPFLASCEVKYPSSAMSRGFVGENPGFPVLSRDHTRDDPRNPVARVSRLELVLRCILVIHAVKYW